MRIPAELGANRRELEVVYGLRIKEGTRLNHASCGTSGQLGEEEQTSQLTAWARPGADRRQRAVIRPMPAADWVWDTLTSRDPGVK